MVANSPRLLLLTFAAMVVGSSAAYAVVEHTKFINAVYWSLVTADHARLRRLLAA
jgi:hypothetical protein